MKNTVKIATLGALGALATLLAACNTVDGVGKDVEAGGEVIQDTAQDVEEDINDKAGRKPSLKRHAQIERVFFLARMLEVSGTHRAARTTYCVE